MHTLADVPDTRITLDDVAATAGVSRMTVSNVYGRPEKVAPGTRTRVLRAAAGLGYGGPSAAGRSLRRGRSGVIGVLVSNALPHLFTDPGTAEFLRGLTCELSEADLSMQVVRAWGPSAPRKVADSVVDAWVPMTLPDDEPAVQAVLDRRLPLVVQGGPHLPGVPCVTVDNVAAARGAVEHLAGLGHRSFAVVTWGLGHDPRVGRADQARQSGAPVAVWRERLRGCRDGVEAVDVDWADVPVVECAGNSRADGRSAGLSLLAPLAALPARSRAPLAVLTATDALAFGVLQAARELGLRVPGDVSVVGFDDVEESAATTPGLTTVRQDLVAQGRDVARLAAGLVSVDGDPLRIHPTELVVRGSTAPPGGTP